MVGKPALDIVNETFSIAGEYVGVIASSEIAGADVWVIDDAAEALAELAYMVEIGADAAAVDQAQFESSIEHAGKVGAHGRLRQRRHRENRFVVLGIVTLHRRTVPTGKNALPQFRL